MNRDSESLEKQILKYYKFTHPITGERLSVSKISIIIGVSRKTVTKYLDRLQPNSEENVDNKGQNIH